jgi:hypothetical protein
MKFGAGQVGGDRSTFLVDVIGNGRDVRVHDDENHRRTAGGQIAPAQIGIAVARQRKGARRPPAGKDRR